MFLKNDVEISSRLIFGALELSVSSHP